MGQERTGKTSLKRSLKGEPFDRFEESTDGIQADPAYFKVSKEIWKTGKKIKDAGPESSLSFENLAAAKLTLERLRKEIASSQDLPEEQSRTATHFAAKETDTDVALSSPSRSDGSKNSHRHMLEIPEEVVKQLKKMMRRKKDVCDNDDIYSILWDFAGQSVYYDTHPIFLIENAIYLLVANLSHNPKEKATPSVKKGLFRNTVDSHSDRTNLDFLDFWMSSIFSLVGSELSSSETATASHENLPGRLPPVFLVCTHADKPFLNTNARDQALEVFGFLRSKAYREHLFKDVFVVDNTKSGGDHECPEVVRLREKVLAVAKELPLMKNKIPLRWLKYESLLHIRMKRDKWIPLDEARRIAFGECTVHNEAEFLTLLNFLHDQRIVVHFSGSPELERMVILDPQWLVDVLKKIITVKRYEHSEKQVEALWLKLEETGILDERLIDHAWRHLFDNQESRNSLIAIMERLSLLYSWPSADSNRQYLVPSMLMSPPTEDVLRLLDSVKIPSLFITFASGRVPPGLFSRLILLFLPWCNEEWNSKMTPQLFHNFAIFHILPGQGVSLIFRCHSSSIEIVVYSGDIDNETGAKKTRGNIDQTLSRAIHWKLRLVLECMRKEFHWLKNVKYDMCVCCPVCSQPGSVKCHPHDVHGCECLHFLSESDLRQRQYCDRPGHNPLGDCRIRVKQFECWFSFEDVEESAGTFTNWQLQDFHAPRHGSCLDEKGIVPSEGAKRKELALPERVKNSIQSIPLHSARDVKDIMIQFQEALQLEPASLTSPEPETKNMIRGLVLRAKSEQRDDLVRHLRKITPAGTAGPLLNEDMSVGCMPFKQYKDLTFSLSGGDEWKLLAERLGFSQIEIRFLDKRVVNPSEVVLGAVGKHRHLSVGELYDTLVDCELPVTADLM